MKICDDGGPGSTEHGEKQEDGSIIYRHVCELGTDCLDCGPREIPYPDCECCAVVYAQGPGALCRETTLWELRDWECLDCPATRIPQGGPVKRDEFCGKVSYNVADRLIDAGVDMDFTKKDPEKLQKMQAIFRKVFLQGGGRPAAEYRDPACADPFTVDKPQPSPYAGLEAWTSSSPVLS